MLRAYSSQAFNSLGRRYYGILQASDGVVKIPELETPFPFPWLRDSCQCPACVHPSTKQKLRESSSISPFTQPSSDHGSISYSQTSHALTIQWDPRYEPNQEAHTSIYPLDFLKRYSSRQNVRRLHKDLEPIIWTADKVKASPNLYISYNDIHRPSGLLKAIKQLSHYGLLFVTGVPHQETSDLTCELQSLAFQFGEIRETFYGRVWDVKNVRNSKNIAYTDLNLDLHMDLLYFQHPPRYQILHCLRNRVKGGTSIFVDAFEAARQVYEQSPEDFKLLCDTPVDFHYINDGHHLRYTHPTIALTPSHLRSQDDDLSGIPEISHVNYSPPFQAPLPINTPPSFYSALALFADRLRDPANRFEYTLKEGDAVIFDNRRSLHARTGFKEWEDDERPSNVPKPLDGESSRWLKGCYLEADAVFDRMRVLRSKLEADH